MWRVMGFSFFRIAEVRAAGFEALQGVFACSPSA